MLIEDVNTGEGKRHGYEGLDCEYAMKGRCISQIPIQAFVSSKITLSLRFYRKGKSLYSNRHNGKGVVSYHGPRVVLIPRTG